jgi:hypothetical protein
MPKREYTVIIVRPGMETVDDTIEVKTTAYYPHFILKQGSGNLEIIEPIPVTPWKKRTRNLWVGENQSGYYILDY